MKEYDEYDGYDSENDESIDLKPYIRKVLGNWKTLLVFAVCGALFGVMIGLSTPRRYTAKAVVAPEILTRATTGGLSSLASLAGINTNALALTDAMHPDMYPEIIHSPEFYIKLFDMPVTVETKDSLVHTDLYDYMLNYTKRPWWGYVVNSPKIALGAIVKALNKNRVEEESGHAHVDSLRLTKEQAAIVKALSHSISATVEKRTYVLSLKVTMQNRVIAAQLANAVIDNLRDFVVSYRTEKARENVEYYKTIYEQTRSDYLAAQRAYTYYIDTHQGLAGRSNMVYQQPLQNEAQLRYSMYSQTAQNLLNAEAKVQQEAPVLVVIQPGRAPVLGQPSRTKLALLWMVIGGMLGIAWILLVKDRKKKDEAPAEEA